MAPGPGTLVAVVSSGVSNIQKGKIKIDNILIFELFTLVKKLFTQLGTGCINSKIYNEHIYFNINSISNISFPKIY